MGVPNWTKGFLSEFKRRRGYDPLGYLPVLAGKIVDSVIRSRSAGRDSLTRTDLSVLRHEARRALSGLMGSSIANMVLRDRLPIKEQERSELLRSVKEVGKTLRLSRQELAEANRELALLKEFSENIIESLPLGVATMDEGHSVKYWNRAMENITGLSKADALGEHADLVLMCLTPDLTPPELKEGAVSCMRDAKALEGQRLDVARLVNYGLREITVTE